MSPQEFRGFVNFYKCGNESLRMDGLKFHFFLLHFELIEFDEICM